MTLATWTISAAWWLLCLPLRLLRWLFSGGEETYVSLDHLALNVSRPTTEWTNMGNWETTDDYAEAGRAMATLLFEGAGLQRGASAILDVGHGPGDSLLLLRREYQPRLLHGVTTVAAHSKRARMRLQQQAKQDPLGKTSPPSSATTWELFCDDALRFVRPSVDQQRYSFIFALDCAFHFRSRRRFLELCLSRLEPGGKLALLDLAASHPYPSRHSLLDFTPSPSLPPPGRSRPRFLSACKHRLTTMLSGVPLENMIPIEQYHAHLQRAGYVNISIRDTSHLVFPGFASFLKRYGTGDEAAWRGGGMVQAAALRGFGGVVEAWSRGGDEGMVRSVLVVAERPS